MSRATEDRLAALMAECARDPFKFVTVAFPWGEKGTELEGHEGPDVWQAKVLCEIRDKLAENPYMPIREAISSGHGVGKSSLGAWLVFWCLATCPDARCIITANTEPQLRTKTWPEISRWHRLFIAPDWFHVTATSMYSADPKHERTWRADAIPWSVGRPEAFAGLHNQGNRILVLFDESSSIDDVIWEVAEGALTDAKTEIIWLAAGNPTRNTGRFRECFPGGRFQHRWSTHKVDSRTAKMTNKTELEEQVRAYGEDHDIVRVRIRGEFPRGGSMQFIPSDLVDVAMSPERDVVATELDPLVLGVDVARFGCFDDETEILTDGGWKLFSALDGGERVLSLNGDVAEWGAITQIHRYPFVGHLNLYQSCKADFCITDNHRLPVRTGQKSDTYALRRYDELPNDYRLRAWNGWSGSSPPSIAFSTIKEMPHGGAAIYRNEFKFEDWCAFLGWFCSEGNVYIEKRHTPRYRILIAQYPGPKRRLVETLLTTMGIKWRNTPNGFQIEFVSQSIGRHLIEHCGVGAANKRIPTYVKEASAESIRAFLDTYLLGDGSMRADGNGRHYVTSSRAMADDLQEVLGKIGRAGKLRVKNVAATVGVIGGREFVRQHDTYIVYERSDYGRGPLRRDKFLSKSKAVKMPYSGYVWCVSTPHQTIYVRRNGVPMWSGNSDQSVLYLRRGRDARSIPPLKLRGVSTVTLAQHISQWNEMYRPDAIFIDEGGVGGGVVDHCHFLGLAVVGVQFGASADRMASRTQTGAAAYANKRAEMWGTMKDWLRGGALPEDPELKSELTSIEYGHRMIDGRDAIQLERKQDMKKRGLSSPDVGDALALTFSYPVEKRDHTADIAALAMGRRNGGGGLESEYDPFQAARDAALGTGPRGTGAQQGWMPGRQPPWGQR